MYSVEEVARAVAQSLC